MFILKIWSAIRFARKVTRLAQKAEKIRQQVVLREEHTKVAIAALGAELGALATVKEQLEKWN